MNSKIKNNWNKLCSHAIFKPLKSKTAKRVLFLVLLFLITLGLYTGTKTASVSSEKGVSEMVQKVSKLMVLPAGETPTMYEIADPKFLVTKEPFFVGAEKGDILLIYQKTGKAIIYSKERNLIVNAGPLVNAK